MRALASLRAHPIEFDLGEWIYEIPEMWAVDWLEVLADRQPIRVVPGLLHPEDQIRIVRDMIAGRITTEDVLGAARAVIEQAGGRKWWSVQKLVDSALEASTWPVLHGQMLRDGVDLRHVTLAGFCDLVQVIALAGCEKQSDRDKMMWDIEKPPPGFAEEAELTGESEFMAMLGTQQRIAGSGGQQMIGQ